jgi:hypothetical protein
VAGAMEQIRGLERNLGWKERRDDISGLCDADVFPAVDYRAQEAGLYRDFHFESSVWLDGDRMGGCAGLGVRERRPAAGVCDGRAGAVLRSVRGDHCWRSFLPKLRASAVSWANDKALSETRPSTLGRATNQSIVEAQPPPTLSCRKTCACASGIPHPLLGNAKDGAPSILSEILSSAIGRTTWPGETFACTGGIPHLLLKNAKDGTPVKARIVSRVIHTTSTTLSEIRPSATIHGLLPELRASAVSRGMRASGEAR